MAEDKTIFISYCHANKNVANEIDQDFKAIGITLIKDERELTYNTSVKAFMKRVRK